jgi:hypothetical protein
MTGIAQRVATVVAVLGCGVLLPSAPAHSAPGRPDRLGAPAVRGDARDVATFSAGPTGNPLADPASNTKPSQTFLSACYSMGRTKAANDRCDAAALRDFDKVRAREGMSPMRLPGGFDRLAVPSQLLAISDIERVDRGLRPVLGLSSTLNSFARKGARIDQDPQFPPYARSGSANWAGAGSSALLDDFFWMYDDGLGSGNIDCTQADQSGCWGHRHDILYPFDAPLLMGAAVAYRTMYGTSMTEEFIGADTTDTADVAPTWVAITQQPSALAISVSKHSIRAHHTITVTGTVTALDPHDRLADQRVALQRHMPHGHWTDLSSKRSGPRGAVRFHLRPARTARYRLQARSGKAVELTSRAHEVVVRRR